MFPALLALAACHNDEVAPTNTDAGGDIAWLSAGAPDIASPEIDWLDAGTPSVAPPSRTCPSGWTEEALEGGGHQCDPWPTGARAECADGNEMNLPGSGGCAAVGSACPAGDWPDDAVDLGTWFVAVGGTGAGTRDDPFGTIASALAAASPGDTIVLGEGTFDEPVRIEADLTLRGLCPSRTTLTRTALDDEESGVVEVDGGTVTLLDLRVADTGAIGVRADSATLSLSGVVIDGATTHGIQSVKTVLSLSDVLIKGISPKVSDETAGDGIYIENGSLVATGLGITTSYRMGIWNTGATLDISDFVVFGMKSEVATGTRGAALRHDGAADAIVRRAAVDDLHAYSFALIGAGDLTIEDLWVDGIALDDSAGYFGGVGSQGTGAFTLSGAVIQDVTVAEGVRLYSNDGTAIGAVRVEDTIVRDTGYGLAAANAPDNVDPAVSGRGP